MRLDNERPSGNIEDRRGAGGGFGFPRGGGMRVPIGGRGGLGIGGIIVILIISFIFGINPLDILSGGGIQIPTDRTQSEQTDVSQGGTATPSGEAEQFVARVLGSTERIWGEVFPQKFGKQYEQPRLVLFSDAVQSACGMAQSAMGPFYCPQDSRVYIDLSFFEDMERRLGASGDFARAYVIAHEVGHHVQNLLGIAEQVTRARMQSPEAEANALSVRMELQADCFSGVWAKSADETAKILEEGDIEEGLNAASQIGDDRLQRRSQGYVVPESFTHGTSEQRVRWFKRGFESGDVDNCDTFKTQNL
ncbi:MAG TPA: neutral zinc metallopeptidase [Aestuariivirgaceae bacterium]|nr:neutral zinc metallopeptidase [Aestuariivirgaceae bacterium]